jgi:DNA-binding NtrC family response regulator
MNTTPRVLIVEDERALALAFAAAARQAGAASELAPTAARARRLLRESGPFHALILDIGLPDENGLAFLRGLAERERIPTFVVTAHGEIENTIAARKLGVREFFTKPLDFAAFTAALAAELRAALPEKEAVRPLAGDGAFLGAAPSMRPVFRQIAHACASTEPVLIRGETGTGKTRVARLVHEHSSTAEAVWITHSPGEGNLESNLRHARGGSLLIEEVGGLDPEEQGWLVRSMESADDSFPRLLATSSRDLAAAVTTGALRSDLYYRLQVLEIRLPPLGERLEDLPALADFFAGQLAPGRLVEFAEAALACLLGHDWPGNLRELRNVVSFALTAAAGAGLLESRHLPVHLGAGARAVMDSEGEVPKALRMALSHWIDERLESDPRPNYRDLSEALESVLIEELLPRYGGRLARLASDLQANRTTLRKRLRGAADTD